MQWPADASQQCPARRATGSRGGKKAGGQSSTIGGHSCIASLGVLSTGGVEDDQVVAPIAVAQEVLGRPGAVRRVYVSALTETEDALARRDPKTMNQETLRSLVLLAVRAVDRIPVAGSNSALACGADPASRAERRSGVSRGIKGLMLLITLAALFASALAVSAAMATTIFERRAVKSD